MQRRWPGDATWRLYTRGVRYFHRLLLAVNACVWGFQLSSKRLIAIAVALGASFLFAGCEFSCSFGNRVSSEELNKQVRLSFEDQSGVLLTSIDCDESDADVGSEINCVAINQNDVELTIEGEVTEYDSDTDKIKFDWEVVSAAAPGESFEIAARRSLARQSNVLINDVTCPERIDLKAGNEVDCTAVDVQGNDREVVLTLTDEEGGFDVNLKPLDATPQDSTS